MHNFEQVKDVIEYGKSVHSDLRKFYKSLQKENEQIRVKMLLDYLSRHERHLEETLERFESDDHKGILETWLQYAPSVDIRKLIDSKSVHSDSSVDDVVKLAIEFDDAVVELYREAATECDVPGVKAVFENLVELENQEKTALMRAALFDDM